jgi:ubiquinone/menaquinone biosynthesis C-methylase UbiE
VKSDKPAKDYLWLHLKELPYFRALMRAQEASFYAQLEFPAPVLDVGCGDGHFATVAFDHPIDVGLDPGMPPLREAARRAAYDLLVQSDGGKMPFPDGYFASAFSNSVLEHIPQVEAVLAETFRVLRPGAPFVFCGPNQRFLENLAIGNFLDGIHLGKMGDAYRSFFNRISRHYHSDAPQVWQERLEKAGFTLERWWTYYSPQALHVTEWGHYFGLPSLVSKLLTGRWILAPWKWNLAITERITRRHYQEAAASDEGVCTFLIARRQR